MSNKTMTIELNTQTLAALTEINRTSIVSIFKSAEEKYGLKFEKDSRGKMVYTEQDYELLKKIKKLKDKTKWTYDQCLQNLYDEGELKVHLTTEAEKKVNPPEPAQIPELISISSVPENPTPIQQMKIDFHAQPPLSAPSEAEQQRILEQIQYLENFLHFVRNDVQTTLQRLYQSIDIKFTEKSKELNEMKETLSKSN